MSVIEEETSESQPEEMEESGEPERTTEESAEETKESIEETEESTEETKESMEETEESAEETEESSEATGAAADAAAVQKLIDALPDAESITAENYETVAAQLTAIDDATDGLSDEAFDLLDFTRYDEATVALEKLGETGEPEEDLLLTVNIDLDFTDTTSQSGKVKAKTCGTCYVYVVANNGCYKKLKVTVE